MCIRDRADVFPRLDDLATDVAGDGVSVDVRFVKKGGLPVRYVAADDPTAAAAVREVDLQRKYHASPAELARRLGLSGPRCVALRRHLGIDDDESCVHTFRFGSQVHRRYSDNALRQMKTALEHVDMDKIWEEQRTGLTNARS